MLDRDTREKENEEAGKKQPHVVSKKTHMRKSEGLSSFPRPGSPVGVTNTVE